MNLYLLERSNDVDKLDHIQTMLVAAEDPRIAREFAALSASDEGAQTWARDESSTIKLLGVASPEIRPGVIMTSTKGF